MKRKVFAVCDPEAAYAVKLMEYLNRKKNMPFEVRAFTSVEALLEYGANNPIELLLISDKAMTREVREMQTGRLVVLSEGMRLPELEPYPRVYKYQSSSDVLREVMNCYGARRGAGAQPEAFPVLKKNTEILGVYSPLHRCLKSGLSLTLGQILARQKAVLYLNFEEYAGFAELTGREYENTLTELLYFSRQKDPGLLHRMNGMIQSIGNLDYVPPAKTPWDIRGASFEDLDRLLTAICGGSSYEILVLDIGSEVDEVLRLLQRCDHIYMPVLKDPVSAAKLKQFESLVKSWNCEDILEKTTRMSLPFHGDTRTGEEYIRQLPWSELGDYVRKILRKEGRGV